MSTHNIYFCAKISKSIPELSPNTSPEKLLTRNLNTVDFICCTFAFLIVIIYNRSPLSKNVPLGHVWTAKAEIRLRRCSLIRVFTVLCQNHWILHNVSMESKGPRRPCISAE